MGWGEEGGPEFHHTVKVISAGLPGWVGLQVRCGSKMAYAQGWQGAAAAWETPNVDDRELQLSSTPPQQHQQPPCSYPITTVAAEGPSSTTNCWQQLKHLEEQHVKADDGKPDGHPHSACTQ